ncbi:acyltransferase family protein [Janibacter corallicola]|uniref:acyltransferase family protein n=1 Tax=Janibacter corallicola TaxID=415212 RepID=UPI00083742F6|nr:acyltransferase [Janibacter corallicola]
MRLPSIGSALSSRDNSLNAVRLILAAMVIASHSPLGGYEHEAWERIGPLAVNGFFALSGFLIAGSRLRNGFGRYLDRRARRILPGFWVCLGVVAFLFAPLGALFGEGRWHPAGAVSFVVDNVLLYVFSPTVASTLQGAPAPSEWNGSLWSLPYEFLAYLVFGLVIGLPWVRRHLSRTMLVAVLVLPLLYCWFGDLTGLANKVEQIVRLFAFFAAGAMAYSLKDRLPVSHPLGLLAGVWVVAGCLVGGEEAMHQLTVIPLTYLLLYVGSTWRTRFAATEDISYGMYIYGWPVQQLLALAGVGAFVPQAAFVVLSIACTAPLALLSWRLVEKPAMRLGTRPRPTGDLHPAEATASAPESPRRPVLLGSR